MTSLAARYLKQIPQYTRNARHLRSVIQHGTPRKWANLVRIEIERKLRRIDVTGRPYLLIIDPTNFCNLRCPLCPTGAKRLGREQSMMSFDCFKRYFDPHIPYIFEAYLHNWGESLLNKETFRMIDHAQSNNVGTNMSSNLVIASSDDIDRLIDSGLEYLVVSLDGASQETYGQYRIRGDFETVVANMTELIRRRNMKGRKTPVVEWQYIVMRQNEHETAAAERMAQDIGVDLLRFIPVGLPYDYDDRASLQKEWFPTTMPGRTSAEHAEQTFGQGRKPGPCFYLYRSMVVNADGGVSPCCVVYQKDRDFADLGAISGDIDVTAIYNNDMFRSARSLFSEKAVEGRCRTVCDGCDIFAMHPSKAGRAAPPAVSARGRHPAATEAN